MENLKLIANNAISQLMDGGADKAQCVVTSTETHEFNVDGGEFSLFRTLFDNEIDLTAIKDHKKGNIKINHFDDDSIEQAVNNCLNVAESGNKDEAYDIASKQENKKFFEGVPEPNIDLFFERAKELIKYIEEKHPKIIIEQMVAKHEKEKEVYLDSNDNLFEVLSGYYDISLMFSAHEGEIATSFFSSGLTLDNLDKPFYELGSIEKDLTDVENQLNTITLESKFEGVAVITPSCMPSILYSIIRNFVYNNAILDGTSIWKDKLGQKVADERLTISINPLDKRIVCGERYTDDGFISENFDLIKNGYLNSFMLSQYIANKTGLGRSKNSSSSFIIESGDKSIDDIIKNIKKGLIVGRFSGGEPSSNGDFSGVAKNSFLVENGKVVGAVSETMINGNLADLLNNIVDISKEIVEDGESVLPYIAFDKVVISGK